MTHTPKIKAFFRKVLFFEIIKGLSLTLKHLFSRPVTRQYPTEKRAPIPGSRALHALVRDEHSGEAKCVGCGLCSAICPSGCIDIHTESGDDFSKVVTGYEIDVLRCVFCAFCVEACPFGAIVLTDHFAYANVSRDAFFYDKNMLLENWDAYMAGEKGTHYLAQFWKPRRQDFALHDSDELTRGKQ